VLKIYPYSFLSFCELISARSLFELVAHPLQFHRAMGDYLFVEGSGKGYSSLRAAT
jgi:hypothetical protein